MKEIESMLKEQGFTEVLVTPKEESRSFIRDWAPETNAADYIVSAAIKAVKPKI